MISCEKIVNILQSYRHPLRWVFILIIGLLISHSLVSAARIEVQDTTSSGPNTALVFDASNNPIILYSTVSNRRMNLVICNDPYCDPTAGRSTTIIGDGNAYYDPNMLLDANGYPVIVAFNDIDEVLQLFRCTNADCSGVSPQNIDTSELNTGQYFSLALDANGYPVIAYTGSFTDDLKLIHCNDVNCTGNDESISVVDIGNNTANVSLVLDENGYPVISYTIGGDLRLIRCNDVNCAGGDELNIFLETITSSSRSNSLQLDNNGFPTVAYRTSNDIKLTRCLDTTCSSRSSSVLATGGNLGENGVTLQFYNNLPVIAYSQDSTFSERDFALVVVACNDLYCQNSDEIYEDYDAGSNGVFAFGNQALKVNSSGCPIIIYAENLVDLVKVASCDSIIPSTPTPEVTPEITPEVTPEITPEVTPEITPEITPEVTPEITPEVTPEITPEVTPEITPEVTPEITPEVTPEITPEITPEVTPEITPEVTPEITPEVTPEITPEVTPEITPEVTPEITPEVTTESSVTDESLSSAVIVGSNDIFDPAISKIGFLVPGQVGVTGEQLEWIVTVSNTGNIVGNNVVVTDNLIPALQIDRVDAPNASVSIIGQAVSVTYATLNVGEVAQFSIFTTVLDGVTVNNIACVDADNQAEQECAEGISITVLPETGESPFLRTMGLSFLIGCLMLIVSVVIWRKTES